VKVRLTSKLHLQGEGGEGESKVASSGAHDIYLGNGRPTCSLTTDAIHYFLKISFHGANVLNLEFCFSYQGISSDKWQSSILIGTLLYQARVEDSASAPNTLRSVKANPKPHPPLFQPLYPATTASKEPAPRPCAKIRGPSPYRFTRSSPFPITPPSFPSTPPEEGSKGLAWDRQAWANAPPHFPSQAWGPKNKPP
jgi:hypothetical protein